MTAPAYIPIPRHPEYAGASEEAEQLPNAPDVSEGLPSKPCLSRFGLWFCCAPLSRAFTELLVMLGVAAEFEREPHQTFPARSRSRTAR
jgi:hypothetical protein